MVGCLKSNRRNTVVFHIDKKALKYTIAKLTVINDGDYTIFHPLLPHESQISSTYPSDLFHLF